MINSKSYLNSIDKIIDIIPFDKLANKRIMITGACGLIGSFLVDTLMAYNRKYNGNIKVIAIARNENKFKARFKEYLDDNNFIYVIQDISLPISYNDRVDYIMHLASNADPSSFKLDPVGTIKGNVMGLYNLLEYARSNKITRLLYVSSGEVYGEASDINAFTEEYSGYVNPVSARSCYPNSKRCAETLCVSYNSQYGVSTVIARPSHVYGPTMTNTDSRIYAEFIRNVLNDEDITLKSEGKVIRSYTYVADCVSALLYILLFGNDSEAYNIANPDSIVSIKELAETIATIGKRKVVFDIPKEISKNNNPMQCGVLDSSKLSKLGWKGLYDFKSGISDTIKILKEVNNEKR